MTPHDDLAGDAASPLALLEMIGGGWMSQTIYVAARLGIADLLAQGPKSHEELARSCGAHPGALHRLMRGLTSLGLCAERADGAFALTPLGGYLRADVPGSVRSWALHWGGSLWPVWSTLLRTVRTGEAVRPLTTRKDGFDHLAQNPEVARVFNEAMVDITRLVAEGIVRDCDFSGIECLVDVGGGYGELLAAILRAHPTMRGILFDLPHVVDGARTRLEAAGVAERCDVVSGSFFESIPGGVDGCLLKSIIHDWDDGRSLAILTRCRRAMTTKGKLVMIERVLPERMRPSAADRGVAASDLNMLVSMTGRERTAAEYRALLGAASFELTRVVPVGAYFSAIEAVCA